MNAGVLFENIQVNDSLLINGHHRYISSLLLSKEIGANTWTRPYDITSYSWSELEIDENDWESNDIIRRHNLKDAAASSIDIKDLERLI